MSGVDTHRGINFQNACAVSLLLDFPTQPTWHHIQLEGTVDIEDAVIQGADGQILVRIQIKQKRDPQQWQPAELRDILLAFAVNEDTGATEYQFIYMGAQSRTFFDTVRPLLDKLAAEGATALTPEEQAGLSTIFHGQNPTAGERVREFLLAVGPRFRLVRRESADSIETADLRRLRKLLTGPGGRGIAEDYEETVYHAALHAVARKSAEVSQYRRIFTRSEVLTLLQIGSPSPQPPVSLGTYAVWVQTQTATLVPLVPLTAQPQPLLSALVSRVARATRPPITPLWDPLVPSPGVDSARAATKSDGAGTTDLPHTTLLDVVQTEAQLVLVGTSGSGKTTTLHQLAHEYATRYLASPATPTLPPLPILVSLSGYDGESISDLIQGALATADQVTTPAEIEGLTHQKSVLLLVDNLGTLSEEAAADLLPRLRRWITQHPRAGLVITTTRFADAQTLGLATFRLEPLTAEQVESLLTTTAGRSRPEVLGVMNGLPKGTRHLLVSPLTLTLIAYAYRQQPNTLPHAQGLLYETVAAGLLEFNATQHPMVTSPADRRQLLARLARWMIEEQITVLSPLGLTRWLAEWLPGNPSTATLKGTRSDLLHSGVLHTTLEGDIEFIHPSFRAYFAARTLTPADLPQRIDQPAWRESLILWTSLATWEETNALISAAIAVPLLLGQLIQERSRRRAEPRPLPDSRLYFAQVLEAANMLIRHFALLSDAPWQLLPPAPRDLWVSQVSDSGYLLHWSPATSERGQVQWSQEIVNPLMIGPQGSGGWATTSLVPTQMLARYQPAELVYMLIIRYLYDLLEFGQPPGGLDRVALSRLGEGHLAIGIIAWRWHHYLAALSKLPAETHEALRFALDGPVDIPIEVDLDQRVVRYAVLPGHHPGTCHVVGEIVGTSTASAHPRQFQPDSAGVLHAIVDNVSRVVETVEEEDLQEVLEEVPGVTVQQWLSRDLTRYVPGYPPHLW